MRLLLSIIALLFLATACKERSQPPAEKAPCMEVDSIVGQIGRFEEGMENGDGEVAKEALDRLVGLMERNQKGSKECSYLNEELHPEHLRFEFADQITQWAVRDTFVQGIYYLMELRGIFSDDSAISEFFSEEIARVALENPPCYLSYFHAHPAQQQFLLNSTKWSRPDLPTLIDRFRAIDTLGKITAFLSSLPSPRNTAQP